MQVDLRMEQLELARGYDGLLRGAPEPTLIVAVFGATAEHVRLAGRFLYRFERPGGFPCKVSPREPSRESCMVVLGPGARVVLLVLALEEDSGRGLQAAYAALERAEAIVVWGSEHGSPLPMHLSELDPTVLLPHLGHRVHVLVDGHDLGQHTPGDDWVDAGVVHGLPVAGSKRYRLHLCSPDGRNDWTAELLVGMRKG
ncbi:hypothetical protein [Paraliomyxa miuraensis]|uniref:hypothetical protein n=1 Tax=Paraliomyxa miuraensis TaxID=376150 RepID=UPI002257AAD3|nr:hypothetical protein [Paraliomyxa miuraensis]MCX4247241.1 hypothetical protein [Paraliomyxa miuraensis]